MPVTTPLSREHTDAVIARLTAATGKNIGDGEAPPTVTLPYSVVFPLPDTGIDGSLADWGEIVFLSYQVTSVAGTREQAEWMRDQCHAALAGQQLTVTDRETIVSGWSFGPLERDEETEPRLFYAIATYTLRSAKS